jgi:hypothetical protein
LKIFYSKAEIFKPRNKKESRHYHQECGEKAERVKVEVLGDRGVFSGSLAIL